MKNVCNREGSRKLLCLMTVYFYVSKVFFLKKLFFINFNIFLIFSNYFNVLILKIIFFKNKIIHIYFNTKLFEKQLQPHRQPATKHYFTKLNKQTMPQ